MIDIAKLGIEVRSDGVLTATKRLDGMGSAATRAEASAERMQRRARAMARALTVAAAAGGAAMAAFTASSLRLGVAAEETASKFQVVFRGSVEQTNAQLVELTKTVPLTITQMRGLSSGVQDMLVPMGLAREQAAGLSVEAVRLAADIASFNDVDAGLVLENIQSALAGSSEPLRKFGIDVRKSRLEAIALEEGLVGVGDELTQSAIAQATFIAITRDSSDAMGDAARTADSAANQMRFLSRDFKQAQENLGTALIPAFTELLGLLNQVDADGVTPLQNALNGLSVIILQITQTVLLATMQFMHMRQQLTQTVDAIKNAIPALPDGVPGVGILKEYLYGPDGDESLVVSSAKQAFEQVLNPLGIFTEQFSTSIDEQRAKIEELKASGEDVDTEFVKSMESMLGVVADLQDKIDGFKSGNIDKGLEESAKSSAMAADAIQDFGEELREVTRISADFNTMLEFEANMDFVAGLEDTAAAAQSLIDQLDPASAAIRQLTEDRALLQEAFEMGLIDESQLDRLIDSLYQTADAIDGIGSRMQAIGDVTSDSIRQIQLGVERGTDEYKALEVAANAANVIAAVGAVLNQANGDPYTAFPRMAAMAAAVASLGYSVGNLSGGFSGSAEQRQETQGTGSVLGDTEAKSESILNAIEITADATSKLVGINRGMLSALRNLNDAISGATGLIARDNIAGSEFTQAGSMIDFNDFLPGFDFIFPGLGSLLGGKSEVTDEGIAILSGNLQELIDGSLIAAFQELQYKKWRFGSTRTTEQLVDITDDAATQIGLVFQSLSDAVSEAALALGISQDEIEARLGAFRIEEQRISLMDLTAEEQEAELQAVFSRIFDDLAAQVIPFIGEFQELGEGMGETLVRVATSVQVVEAAAAQLGFAADKIDPQQFARLSVDLVDLVGGVDAFIAQFTEFFDLFASDAQKLETMTDTLGTRFNELGLVIPQSREAVWDLMQAQDANTEAGRANIAMLLELGPLLNEYYDTIEEAERARAALAAQQLNDVRSFLGLGPSQALVDLETRFVDAMKAARSLNASQREYAMIVRAYDRQLRALGAQLTLNVIQQAQAFDDLMTNDFAGSVEQGFESVREVSNELFNDWQRALQGISDFTKGVLLDESLTTLSPAEQLAEAQSQFDDTLRRAMAGDVDAAANLPDIAQKLLEEARFMFASGQEYQAIFDNVMAALNGVEMPKGIPETITEISETARDIDSSVRSMQNQLSSDLQKLLQATDLANSLRELGFVVDRDAVALAEELGIPIERLVEALGIDLGVMNQDTIMGLVGVAEMLGTDLDTLGQSLGIDLEKLANDFGINFQELNFETQFATEIDLLSEIEMHMAIVSRYVERLFDPFPREKGGPSTTMPIDPSPPTFAFAGPAPQTNAAGGQSEEVMAEIRNELVALREESEAYFRADIRSSADIAQGISDTNQEISRSKVA